MFAVGVLLAVTPVTRALSQAQVAEKKASDPTTSCDGIHVRATDEALQCAELADDVREITAALGSPMGPPLATLQRIQHKNECRKSPDAALNEYLDALAALTRVSETARRESDRRYAEIDALAKTAETICAVETGIAIATLRQPTPGGPCFKAMMAVEAANKAADAADKKKDPEVEGAAMQVTTAAGRLQTAWEARLEKLQQLSATRQCGR